MEIRNQRLTISPPNNGNVTVTVRYDAVFSALEHFLGLNGLGFQERVQLFGEDSALRGADDPLKIVSLMNIAMPNGTGPVVVPRTVTKVLERKELQEDPSIIFVPDADEIFARITVTPLGTFSGDTERTLTTVVPG